MKYYPSAAGWVTAKADARKGAEPIEIDPSKPGLLAFLNAHVPIPPDPVEAELDWIEPPLIATDGAPHPAADRGEACPNCGQRRKDAERLATTYFEGLQVQAIVDKVMELDGHQLGNVLHAGADRLRELERRALRLQPQPAQSQTEPATEPAEPQPEPATS